MTESTQPKETNESHSSLQASSKLITDAVVEIANIVESMHLRISPVHNSDGASDKPHKKNLTSLVYASIRSITELVGKGIDLPLGVISKLVKQEEASSSAEALRSALNGVIGDHLVQRKSPLAITMKFRKDGTELKRPALVERVNASNGKLVIMVHGLCMNDLQWQQGEHNHGVAINRDLGHSDVYLHYNTGLHISENGKTFSQLLEQLVMDSQAPPFNHPLQISIIGHSMGGLVTRSALHHAKTLGQAWPEYLKHIICLGTPHHGAPLEKTGNWIDLLLGIHSYSAPLTKLTQIRSSGITDLRYGYIVDADWQTQDRFALSKDDRNPIPLPESAKCYTVATTTTASSNRLMKQVIGDGLVPLKSALGQHKQESLTLKFDGQFVGSDINHIQLLSNTEIYKSITRWLSD